MTNRKFDPGVFQFVNIIAFILWIPGMFVAGMASGAPSAQGLIFNLWFYSTAATGPVLLVGIFIRKAGAIGIPMILISLMLYGLLLIRNAIN